MPSTKREAAAAFLAMHKGPGGFILPNAWDAGSAVLLAAAGFPAIATTSAGIAFSLGRQDYGVSDARLGVSADAMFARLAEIVGAVAAPVSADLEAGFGDTPEAVAATITRAIGIGLAGGNIEDKIPMQPALYDEVLSSERIAAARAAIAASGVPFVLNARTDVLLLEGPKALSGAIARANALLEAGADCVFVPGGDAASVAVLVREIAGPLNVVIGLNPALVDGKAAIAAGAKRVSLGGTIARAALGLVKRAA